MNMASILNGLKNSSPVVAWLVFLYVLIKDFKKRFLERVNVDIFSGDTLYIIRSANKQVRKIQLGCNFVNNSGKLAVIHKVIVRATSEDLKEQGIFSWNIFYKYAEARRGTEYQAEVFPIVLRGHESVFRGIEFYLTHNKDFRWKEGKFNFVIGAWVNQKDISSEPRSQNRFSATVKEADVFRLYSPVGGGRLASFAVAIDGWDLRAYTVQERQDKKCDKFPKFVIK